MTKKQPDESENGEAYFEVSILDAYGVTPVTTEVNRMKRELKSEVVPVESGNDLDDSDIQEIFAYFTYTASIIESYSIYLILSEIFEHDSHSVDTVDEVSDWSESTRQFLLDRSGVISPHIYSDMCQTRRFRNNIVHNYSTNRNHLKENDLERSIDDAYRAVERLSEIADTDLPSSEISKMIR